MRFLNETGCFPRLSGKSSHSTVRPNQGNHRYGSQRSQNSSPYISPRGRVQRVLGVSYILLWNCKASWFGGPGFWGQMAKLVFSLWKLESCSLKRARKTLWIIYLFITAKSLVKHLSFQKEIGHFPLLAWKSLDSPVSSKKREQQVWQTTLTKHSPQISLLMKDCSVSWWASFSLLRSYRERGFCEPGFRDTMAKAVYSPGKLELQPQTRQKNTLLLFFFHYSKNLVKILSFLKETGCWPQLAGKTSDSIVSPIREIIGMAVNTYKTLCPDIFTHEKMLCVLDVSFMLLENCRESWICEHGYLGLMARAVYSPCESYRLTVSNLPKKKKKALCFIYLFITQKVWSSFFFFFK